jgi:hypothetical protein
VSPKVEITEDFPEDAQIQEAIQDILHPYLSEKKPVVAIQFGVPRGREDDWREAISFASGYNSYTTSRVGKLTRHRVEFEQERAWDVHQMYRLVEKSPHLEIFINGMKLPYAATLWLPLLWFHL